MLAIKHLCVYYDGMPLSCIAIYLQPPVTLFSDSCWWLVADGWCAAWREAGLLQTVLLPSFPPGDTTPSHHLPLPLLWKLLPCCHTIRKLIPDGHTLQEFFLGAAKDFVKTPEVVANAGETQPAVMQWLTMPSRMA